MSKKRVALIGHCGPDSSYLRLTVSRAMKDVQVVMADDAAELDKLILSGVDLLLFNRVLDYGFDDSEGVAVIRKLRKTHPHLRMMLVSNYPEAQAEAVAAGALPGFGKREMSSPRVSELIREALQDIPSEKSA
jgi:two-component system, chemotaxis family, chemotaxis protein CheY